MYFGVVTGEERVLTLQGYWAKLAQLGMDLDYVHSIIFMSLVAKVRFYR